ncbi:1,3-beta-glucan synthase subunit FKS1-like, domain-1 [Dillenia turbinata]|uniref:1,3-beta-glucan synthase subunit FKS1-like, domain-1 n=1 Tax=Dillenia turbinata TaxID=194707 RepID=A0AAN8ZGQ3_9MAGN
MQTRTAGNLQESMFDSEVMPSSSSSLLPTIQQEVQQCKLLSMGLHFLIWGKATNLRFMPECLCYIYHHLYGMLAGNVSAMTAENVKPASRGEEEVFLRKVVTPILYIIAKICDNMFLFSNNLQQKIIGLETSCSVELVFHHEELEVNSLEAKLIASAVYKISTYLSTFALVMNIIVALEMYRLIACTLYGTVAGNVSAMTGKNLKPAFGGEEEASLRKVVTPIYDIIAELSSMLYLVGMEGKTQHVNLRYILKVISAAAWVVVLPVTYTYICENPPGFAQTIKSWFGNSSNSRSFFILALVIYLSPNMLSALPLLFLFPFIRRFLESSAVQTLSFPQAAARNAALLDTDPGLGLPTTAGIYLVDAQIQTLGILLSQFQSFPGAFNACLIPPEEKSELHKKKGLKATLPRRFDDDSLLFDICSLKDKIAFILKWFSSHAINVFVCYSDPIALDMAKDRLEAGDLIMEYKMNALPSLYEHFIKLIKYLRNNNEEDRDHVVILFQDMLAVVTRGIMMEDHIPRIKLLVTFTDEWNNFFGRVNCKTEEELQESEAPEDELHYWATYQGQTLTKLYGIHKRSGDPHLCYLMAVILSFAKA